MCGEEISQSAKAIRPAQAAQLLRNEIGGVGPTVAPVSACGWRDGRVYLRWGALASENKSL